jgi:hypothetical protein
MPKIVSASRALGFFCLSTLLMLVLVGAALAQTTSFTYQGRLTDGGTPANGTYEIQFTLSDASGGGTQQPQPAPVTITRTSVQVSAGSFSVQPPLDFGATAFPLHASRLKQIPTGGPDGVPSKWSAFIVVRRHLNKLGSGLRPNAQCDSDLLFSPCRFK